MLYIRLLTHRWMEDRCEQSWNHRNFCWRWRARSWKNENRDDEISSGECQRPLGLRKKLVSRSLEYFSPRALASSRIRRAGFIYIFCYFSQTARFRSKGADRQLHAAATEATCDPAVVIVYPTKIMNKLPFLIIRSVTRIIKSTRDWISADFKNERAMSYSWKGVCIFFLLRCYSEKKL